MSLCIGTVHLGMDYGISNFSGKFHSKTQKVSSIPQKDWNNQIDTAAYGDAEECIEKLDTQGQKLFQNYSKPKNFLDIESWFHASLNNSLKDLNRENIYGYLIHRVEDLLKIMMYCLSY